MIRRNIYIYIYIYIYTHIHMYTYINIYIYIYTHSYNYSYIYIYIYDIAYVMYRISYVTSQSRVRRQDFATIHRRCRFARVPRAVSLSISVSLSLSLYLYIYIYIYTCIYIYIYISIHMLGSRRRLSRRCWRTRRGGSWRSEAR